MASSQRISGILTPNITPVDQRGNVDEDRLRGYVDWLIDHGVDGLYPNGSTGEFVRFTAEERRRIVRIVVEQARGRVPVLAGAAEANAKETIAACNAYGDEGVRAVAIVAPFYYRLSAEGVYAYFREIAAAVRVDVTLYNIPMFASPIDVDTVVRLASESPRIVGIKDSSGDLPNMMRMISAIRPMRDDFSFLTGWDPALAPMLLIGADGGTNATSGVVPELTRALHRCTQAGRIEEAMRLQYQLLPLFDAMISLGEFPEGFRAGARARGWDLGLGRVPVSEDQRQQIASMQNRINHLVASVSDGNPLSQCSVAPFTPNAPSSCTAANNPTAAVEKDPSDVIQEVVRRVLSQLQN